MMNLNGLYTSTLGHNALAAMGVNRNPGHVVHRPGQVIGDFGTPAFDGSVTDVLRDHNIVELVLDHLNLNHQDTVAAIQTVVMSRKWKSVTFRSCQLPSPAAAASARSATQRQRRQRQQPPSAPPVVSATDTNTATAMDVDVDVDTSVQGNINTSNTATGTTASAAAAAAPAVPTSLPANAHASATASTGATATASTGATANRRRTPSPSNRMQLFTRIMQQARRLEFKNHEIPDHIATALSECLMSQTCWVSTLSFYAASFSLESAQVLGHGIRNSPRLKELGISQCQPDPFILGALLLPTAAQQDPHRYISPGTGTTAAAGSGSSSSADSAAAVTNDDGSRERSSEALTTQLRALFFRDCFFGKEHIDILSHSLQYHEKLFQLWLNGRQSFDGDALDGLVAAIERHYELEHVQFPSNLVLSHSNKKLLQQSLELNRGGRRLLRGHNDILSLWPIVLERALRIRGLSDESRVSIVYGFVREIHGGSQLR